MSALFNPNDWLTSQTTQTDTEAAKTQTWAYDDNGAELSAASESGSVGNAWSYEGKLLATQTKDAAGAVSGGTQNLFDAGGNRVAQRLSLAGGATKTTSYLVDETAPYAVVVEERAPDVNDAGASQLQARYVCGNGLAPLAMWRKGSDGAVKLFFFVSDGQESVRQLTSTSGVVTDSYFYDVWGNALSGGNGSTANPFRYTGQQLDSDGRYYLRARFYNPAQGRFLGHDPLMGSGSDPVSMHRYLYAGVDGVNGVDPSGLSDLIQTTAAVGGAAIIAAESNPAVLQAESNAIQHAGEAAQEINIAETQLGNAIANLNSLGGNFTSWMNQYLPRLSAGQVTVQESVNDSETLGLRAFQNEGFQALLKGDPHIAETETLTSPSGAGSLQSLSKILGTTLENSKVPDFIGAHPATEEIGMLESKGVLTSNVIETIVGPSSKFENGISIVNDLFQRTGDGNLSPDRLRLFVQYTNVNSSLMGSYSIGSDATGSSVLLKDGAEFLIQGAKVYVIHTPK